jgi:hypothetical protein
LRWVEIAFKPDAETTQQASEAWKWLIDEPWEPLVCTMFGGLFLEKESGGVYWLECSTGAVEQVAENSKVFDTFLGGARDARWWRTVDNWFLVPLVQQLRDAGMIPNENQCYGFTILPIFEGGACTVENTFLVPRAEWLSFTGSFHRQMSEVPDGAKVRIVATS